LIEEIVSTEKVDCDFERLDGYLFPGTTSADDSKLINQEFFAAKSIGLNEVELVNALPISSIKHGPVLKFPKQGQFNPVKVKHGLKTQF
jgi:hypothetical protein